MNSNLLFLMTELKLKSVQAQIKKCVTNPLTVYESIMNFPGIRRARPETKR